MDLGTGLMMAHMNDWVDRMDRITVYSDRKAYFKLHKVIRPGFVG